jgi:hypothetical protein
MLLLVGRLRNLLLEKEDQLQSLALARARNDGVRVNEIQSILFDLGEQLTGLRAAILSTLNETQRATLLSRESWAGWSAVFNAVEGACRALETRNDDDNGRLIASSHMTHDRRSMQRVAEEVAAAIQ